MPNIFVSYRREDSVGYVVGLTDRLAQRFGREHVFMDIDSVQPGDLFAEVIRDRVGTCDVELVVIGPKWVQCADNTGGRRLADPDDFVRLEVETALERQILVIPVLVGGVPPLKAHELPESLRPLVRRQAMELSNSRFGQDVERLIQVLDRFADRIAKAKEGRAQFQTPETSGTGPATAAVPSSLPTLPRAATPSMPGSDTTTSAEHERKPRSGLSANNRALLIVLLVALVSAIVLAIYQTRSGPTGVVQEPIRPSLSDTPAPRPLPTEVPALRSSPPNAGPTSPSVPLAPLSPRAAAPAPTAPTPRATSGHPVLEPSKPPTEGVLSPSEIRERQQQLLAKWAALNRDEAMAQRVLDGAGYSRMTNKNAADTLHEYIIDGKTEDVLARLESSFVRLP